MKELSHCPKCYCMTKSIRLGRDKYKCGKCGADKSLSDVFDTNSAQSATERVKELRERIDRDPRFRRKVEKYENMAEEFENEAEE